jgi:hypothetical protein
MQKVINILAVLSFIGTAGIVGGGTALYLNKDSIIENAKNKITAAASEAIAGALPGMPELPSATGGVVGGAASGVSVPPIPSTTGPALPF